MHHAQLNPFVQKIVFKCFLCVSVCQKQGKRPCARQSQSQQINFAERPTLNKSLGSHAILATRAFLSHEYYLVHFGLRSFAFAISCPEKHLRQITKALGPLFRSLLTHGLLERVSVTPHFSMATSTLPYLSSLHLCIWNTWVTKTYKISAFIELVV